MSKTLNRIAIYTAACLLIYMLLLFIVGLTALVITAFNGS